MPFKSMAQERFMYSQHPDIASKWQKEFGQPQNLPKKIGMEPMHKPRLEPEKTIKSPWLHMSTQKLEGGM